MIAISGEADAIELYGVLALPLPTLPDGFIEFADEAHEALGTVLLGVIGLHVAAALYHFAVVGEAVMQRMLPGHARRS